MAFKEKKKDMFVFPTQTLWDVKWKMTYGQENWKTLYCTCSIKIIKYVSMLKLLQSHGKGTSLFNRVLSKLTGTKNTWI